jgi:hypothetical protein
MDPRTTISGRTAGRHRLAALSRHPRLSRAGRPGIFLGVAVSGAVLVNVLVGTGPAAEAGTSDSVSVAQELGLSAQSGPIDVREDLQPLQDLAASRSTRAAEESAAQQAQAAADQAARDRQQAEADAAAAAAAAKAAAEADAAAKAAEAAKAAATTAPQPQAGKAAAPSVAVTAVAHITNSSGPVHAAVQAAADAVVSNVAGAAGITLGGTRASATDPDGHPSGKALDYMVMSNGALGDAIVAYHIAHWDELGVEYLIYRQRMLSSPGGSWKAMENRGSPTANHMDHVHVNYLG